MQHFMGILPHNRKVTLNSFPELWGWRISEQPLTLKMETIIRNELSEAA